MAAINNYIPEKIYKSLSEYAPRVCVDLVIVNGKRFLMGERKIDPAKGLWFFIGGRVSKGETKEQAVKRKFREELGVKSDHLNFKLIGVEDLFLVRNKRFYHDLIIVFLIKTKEEEFKHFDKQQHSRLAWFDKIDTNWHPYIKKM